ncbi:glycerate kinase [Phormidesmis priestleyi]
MKSLNQLLEELINGQSISSSDPPEVAPQLEALILQNQTRANAFGITAENAREVTRLRTELFQKIYPEFLELCQNELKITKLVNETLWNLWLPLAIQIADWRRAKLNPLIQGFLGGQGTGKTTLTEILKLILKHLGYHTISFSLDDLYLTYDDRQRLQAQDPRLIRRGPPGTHDIALGLQILAQLKQRQPTQIPQFDKSLWQGAGDRIHPKPVSEVDIVLFEGWFVGARPISATKFEMAPDPIVTSSDRTFAQDMNDRLHDYLPLWEQLDRLIVLYVPDYRLSKVWRKEAEHKMIAQGKSGMSDVEIDAFVEYFWQALHPELFIKPLVSQSEFVDLVIEINSDHSPGAVRRIA